ncbi:MAG: alpha/beta hydrolase fold domain-containing protein [Pseudomonadota bacterium]
MPPASASAASPADLAARLHPGIAHQVRQAMAAPGTPAHLQSPAEVRAVYLAGKKPLVRQPGGPHEGLHIQDTALERGGAPPLPLRLYRPQDGVPAGALAYFHGGGFTNGDLDSHDAVACALAAGTGCAVASVDYRVMPAHIFPAAFDDAVDVLRWLPGWAAALGIAPGAQGTPAALGAGGDSAGANLALAAALALRGSVPLRALWLAYPIIGADFDTPSYAENAEAPLLTRARCQRILHDYRGGALQTGDWRVAPLLAPDLAGLPPAVAIAAELDPLRSDAEILVERLAPTAPGTILVPAQGMPHGFLRWVADSDACAAVAKQSFAVLRRLMAASGPAA